jgi:predicted metal-dependent phosphoesterase TrpH
VKLDAHVHTYHSGNLAIPPVQRFVKESYNTPEKLYRCAKIRGMDLVTITDHDSIAGALMIADRNDVIIGCEVTATFPEDGTTCHIGVLGITEEQFREIDKLRHNALELMPYLKEQAIFSTLNHLASRSAGRLTAAHLCSLLPWISAIETRNGARLPSQNQTALALARAHKKVTVAGSDSHTYRGIGRTYINCKLARNREEFLTELRESRVRIEGQEGCYFTLSADILRLAARVYADGVVNLVEHPLDWKQTLTVLCLTLALPVTAVALIASVIHYIREERFNHNLLLDLVASARQGNPRPRVRALVEPVV